MKTYTRKTKYGKLIKFIYSECDNELVDSLNWYSDKDGYIVGKVYVNGVRKNKRLHRLLKGDPKNLIVDHIDGDITNNTQTNLRICTQEENHMNRKLSKNNTSGVTGVCWHKRRKKWKAQIKVNSKTIDIGYFEDKKDAINARKESEIRYFGEFRRKNEMV